MLRPINSALRNELDGLVSRVSETQRLDQRECHDMEGLLQIIREPNQTTGTLLRRVDDFLPTMVTDVIFLGVFSFQRKHKMVNKIRMILEEYPLVLFVEEDLNFMADTLERAHPFLTLPYKEAISSLDEDISSRQRKKDEVDQRISVVEARRISLMEELEAAKKRLTEQMETLKGYELERERVTKSFEAQDQKFDELKASYEVLWKKYSSIFCSQVGSINPGVGADLESTEARMSASL